MGELLGYVFSSAGPVVVLSIVAIWLWRRPASRGARRLAAGGAIVYLVASLAIVPYGVSCLLTIGYHQLRAADVPAGRNAIVVFGGGDRLIQGWTDTLTVTTPVEAERVLEAARVFRLIAPDWIISSGGRVIENDPGAPSAATMKDELVRLGVPADRIVLEDRSRSTYENAAFVAPLLKSLRIEHTVLVTSGSHMRRAIGVLRSAGIDAIPAVAPSGELPTGRFVWIVPTRIGLEWSGSLAHEVAGIPYYWLRGRWR